MNNATLLKIGRCNIMLVSIFTNFIWSKKIIFVPVAGATTAMITCHDQPSSDPLLLTIEILNNNYDWVVHTTINTNYGHVQLGYLLSRQQYY